MDLLMMAAAATLLTLSGWHLVEMAQRRSRGRLIERRLREIDQQFPPRPEFKEQLRQRLFPSEGERQYHCLACNRPGILPPSSPPQAGPSTSGSKPQRSSNVSQEGIPAPWVTTGGAGDSSNLPGLFGSDTRGRVSTIGPTGLRTPVWHGPSTSTARDGASGRADGQPGGEA